MATFAGSPTRRNPEVEFRAELRYCDMKHRPRRSLACPHASEADCKLPFVIVPFEQTGVGRGAFKGWRSNQCEHTHKSRSRDDVVASTLVNQSEPRHP